MDTEVAAQLRLECVKIAMECGYHNYADLLRAANTIMQYVEDGKLPPMQSARAG